MWKYVITFILLFLYCANIAFFFFPGKIKTTLVIGVIGFIYYTFKFNFKDPYHSKSLVQNILPLALWMGLSILLNQSDQPWFLQYVILQIVYFFGAVFIIDVCKLKDFKTLCLLIVLYVISQNIIALLGFQNSAIFNLVSSLQHARDDYYENLLEFRARGFGEHVFFTGGVWSALAFLPMTYLYKKKYITLWLFVLLVVVNFVAGLFVARTTMVGMIALIMLVFPINKNVSKILGFGVVIVCIVSLALSLEQYLQRNDVNTGYAYEVIDNYITTGEIKTSSSDRTIEMWNTLPDNIKTWVIGDAQYVDTRGGYYKHIDVGYLRIIFYGGLIGLFFYLLYTVKILKMIYEKSGRNYDMKVFLALYFILVLMIMWKGHDDTNHFLYLILSVLIYNNRYIKKQLR